MTETLIDELRKKLESQYKERGEKTIFNGYITKEDELYEWISFNLEIPGRDLLDYPLISNVFRINKITGNVLQVYKTDILYKFCMMK